MTSQIGSVFCEPLEGRCLLSAAAPAFAGAGANFAPAMVAGLRARPALSAAIATPARVAVAAEATTQETGTTDPVTGTAESTTTLTLSNSSPYMGQSITLTVQVGGGEQGTTPTGTIVFKDDTTVLGTVDLIDGRASLTVTFNTAGEHPITASYQGDADYAASDSAAGTASVAFSNFVDLLVVYTKMARKDVGGEREMARLIRKSVSDANTAFWNSRIAVTLRLVAMREVAYAESGSFDRDLDRLQNLHDGYMDRVGAWRDAYHADLVSLFADDGDDGGLAYQMDDMNATDNADWGYSEILVSQADAPTYTLAHELGHNFGAGHDIQNEQGPAIWPYAYGYRFRVGRHTYHDIMAYDPGDTIPYFSNPRLKYRGVAIGNARTADNARVINQTAAVVAAYR
jgi:hypothetical protein